MHLGVNWITGKVKRSKDAATRFLTLKKINVEKRRESRQSFISQHNKRQIHGLVTTDMSEHGHICR